MKKIGAAILLCIGFATVGCKKNNASKQAELDEAIIVEYIEEHKLSAVATGTGLYYVIDQQGTGAQPHSLSTVKVDYTGYLTNGNVFDESGSEGITIGLNQVIKGWQEGIPYFKEGGEGKLLIPSALGYGDRATGSIPANSVLIFDIKLLKVY